MNQGLKDAGHSAERGRLGAWIGNVVWCGLAPRCGFNAVLVANAHDHGSWMAYSGGRTLGVAPGVLRAVEISQPLPERLTRG